MTKSKEPLTQIVPTQRPIDTRGIRHSRVVPKAEKAAKDERVRVTFQGRKVSSGARQRAKVIAVKGQKLRSGGRYTITARDATERVPEEIANAVTDEIASDTGEVLESETET